MSDLRRATFGNISIGIGWVTLSLRCLIILTKRKQGENSITTMARTKQTARKTCNGAAVAEMSTKKYARRVPRKVPKGPGIMNGRWIGNGKLVSETGPNRKVKFKPGTVAVREIKKYQGRTFRYNDQQGNQYTRHIYHKTATQLIIPKLSFQLVVREIARDIKSDLRFELKALEALQVAAENHLVGVFRDANLCAIHNNRQTLFSSDMRLASNIRRDHLPKLPDPKFPGSSWFFQNSGCFARDKGELRSAIPQGLFRSDGVSDRFTGAPTSLRRVMSRLFLQRFSAGKKSRP